MAGHSMSPSHSTGTGEIDSAAANLRTDLDYLLGEHIILAAKATGAALGGRADQFAAYGLQLDTFQIGAITPPDEVQAKIDERSSIGALGNLDQYMKYRTAQAIGDAANNPGTGGDAFGAGIGIGLGSQVANAMRQQAPEPQPQQAAQQQYQQPPGAPAAAAGGAAPTTGPKFCPNCGFGLTAMPDGGPPKFCPNCGNKLRD